MTRHFEDVCVEVFSVSTDYYVTCHFVELCFEVFSVSIDCYMYVTRHFEEVRFEVISVSIDCCVRRDSRKFVSKSALFRSIAMIIIHQSMELNDVLYLVILR